MQIPRKLKDSFLIYSLLCLCWFIVRTGRKPARFAYPCQRAAASQSLVFLVVVPYIIRNVVQELKERHEWLTIRKVLSPLLLIGFSALAVSASIDEYQTMKNRRRLEKVKISLTAASISGAFGEGLALAALPSPHRVVMVHDSSASTWHEQSSDYWNMIDQATVDEMVSSGLKALTGTASVSDAWRTLIPNYQPHH